jgi:hypothetical protein
MSSRLIRVLILGNTLTLDLVRRVLSKNQEFCVLHAQVGALAPTLSELLSSHNFTPDMIVTDCQTTLPEDVGMYMRSNQACQILTVDPQNQTAFLPTGIYSAIPMVSDLASMIRVSALGGITSIV